MRRLIAALLVALGAISAMEIEAAEARAACVQLMPDAYHRTGWQAVQVAYWYFSDYNSTIGRWVDGYGHVKGWAHKSSPTRNARPDTIIYHPDQQGRDDATNCRRYN